MRKHFVWLVVMLLGSINLIQAQSGRGIIKGQVTDGAAKVIESATISLLRAADSSLAKMGVADKTGEFQFDQLKEGRYLVSVSAIGHQTAYSEVATITAAGNTVQLNKLQLVPAAKSMSGVTVTSRKPPVEQKAGKTVVNVEASQTNTGLNALELLEKTPGVAVDNDGNISVKGKQGVMILVDGKPTYLSGADLAALLKSMQSSQLDQIEIMTNPPAKYDAAGNSGIINIKTKKGLTRGMNGNANFNYNQGFYDRYNGGVNLNYRNNKINIFGGYNGGTYENYNRISIDRSLYDADKVKLRSIDQVSRNHNYGNYHNVKAGVDYYFNKKNVAGIVVNAGFNNNDENPYSNTNIRDVNGDIQSKLYTFSRNDRRNRSLTSNFNYKHTFDSTGRELTADLDYLYYNNRSNTQLTTQSLTPTDEKIGDDVVLRGRIPSNISIYSGKVDYVHPFKNGLKLEAGVKSSYVETDNRVNYFRSSGTDWVADARSNNFIYKENINAVYGILSRQFKKWELSAGLRMENTNAKGHQVSNDSSFNRHYTNLFPNVGVGYNASEKNQFNFSYSRRLTRPDYDDLNPFTYFLDSLTYGQGNPYLQPQFTHNFELSHTFNRFLTTTVNYTRTNDIITQLLKQNTVKNETYQTQENLSTMEQWGIAMMANIPIKKWWNLNLYANVVNNRFSGLYNNEPVEVQYTSFMMNGTSSFTFAKTWNAELSGWMRTRATEGLLVANGMGALNFGIAKQIMQKKGTVKLGIRDIFFTQQFSGFARYSDIDVKLKGRRDSRQLNLSFTYRFGKATIKPERRRGNGAEDEQSRIK